MSQTADDAGGDRHLAGRLGLSPGNVVQELGYDDDCDDDLRASVAHLTGNALVDEDHEDVVDAVLLWWRDDDGDLVDALVDSLISLGDGGVVWLLTPKAGRDGPRRAGRHRRCGSHGGPAPDEQHLGGTGLVGHPAGHPALRPLTSALSATGRAAAAAAG